MSATSQETHLEQLRALWRRSWPEDVPRELSFPHGHTMTAYLRAWARETPDRPVIVYYGYELTFAELDEASDRFAGFLEREGLGVGDRVAVFLANCPQFLIAFYGILKAGCVHVPINPMFKEAELAFELEDTEPRVVVAFEELLPLLERVRDPAVTPTVVATTPAEYLPDEPTLPTPPGVGDAPARPTSAPEVTGWTSFSDTVAGSPPIEPVEPDPDRLAALNYTGGTTGMPKGCEHTQRDMVYTSACAALRPSGGVDGGPDVSLAFIPIFWIAGEDLVVLAPVFSGSTCVMLTRWDPDAVLQAVERYRVTSLGGTVDNYLELMAHPRFDETDLSSLRTTSAMSFVKKLTVEIRREWQRRAGEHLVLREASYGMTETHTMDTLTYGFQDDDFDLRSQPIFVGVPFPGTEIVIRDFETGEVVPLGETGEVVIRTPSLLKGYWGRPDATAEQLVDGWLHTGDVGTIDERGCLHFLGRQKEMLKVSGMSVFPSELEVLLGRHPAVAACGVVGMPDEQRGEVPVAFLTLAEGHEHLDADEITDWCREQMATFKIPRITILDELPMTTTGKVKKEALKEQHG